MAWLGEALTDQSGATRAPRRSKDLIEEALFERRRMCGRPLECKRKNEFDGRIDCDHVFGLLTRLMTAGPDGVRDPVPNTRATLEGLCTKRVLWILGSTDRHLTQLFHPGINARSGSVRRLPLLLPAR
jgi:hypothetical protein